jgi:hypothetical protein
MASDRKRFLVRVYYRIIPNAMLTQELNLLASETE